MHAQNCYSSWLNQTSAPMRCPTEYWRPRWDVVEEIVCTSAIWRLQRFMINDVSNEMASICWRWCTLLYFKTLFDHGIYKITSEDVVSTSTLQVFGLFRHLWPRCFLRTRAWSTVRCVVQCFVYGWSGTKMSYGHTLWIRRYFLIYWCCCELIHQLLKSRTLQLHITIDCIVII